MNTEIPVAVSTCAASARPYARRLMAIAGLVLITTLLAIAAEPAMAEDKLFGTDSPLIKFVDFMSGPFAYGIVIIALVVTVGALSVGGEFSGFARRMPIVVVAGAIVILASTVIKNLFGADRAAQWPPSHDIMPMHNQPHCMPAEAAPLWPLPGALPHCYTPAPDWLLPVGIVLSGIVCAILYYLSIKVLCALSDHLDRRWPPRKEVTGRVGSPPEGFA